MAEHIDHAAEALSLLESVHATIDRNGTFAPHMMAVIELDEARLHAQLALVEQQRIANLIAVAQMEGGPYKDANGWTRSIKDADGYHVADEDVNPYLRHEIREGLGL